MCHWELDVETYIGCGKSWLACYMDQYMEMMPADGQCLYKAPQQKLKM